MMSLTSFRSSSSGAAQSMARRPSAPGYTGPVIVHLVPRIPTLRRLVFRLITDDLADVEAGNSEILTFGLKRDVGGIVRADEEIGARRGELPRIFLEHAADRRMVTQLPRLQHEVHR